MINTITLMGRLTTHPELKTTPAGTSVTSFNIAVDRNYKKQGSERETDFIPCVAWRSTAEFITRCFRKGEMIAVMGEIQTRKYTDKQGNNRTAFEVIIGQAYFCGGKKTNDETPAENQGDNNTAEFEEIINDEDLLF